MKIIKILSRKQILTIVGIFLLVITTLVIWGYHDKKAFITTYKHEYNKLVNENKELKLEIKNLKEQNELLNRVLELKQKNK